MSAAVEANNEYILRATRMRRSSSLQRKENEIPPPLALSMNSIQNQSTGMIPPPSPPSYKSVTSREFMDQQGEIRPSLRGVLMADYSAGRYSSAANGRERSTGLRFPMRNGTDESGLDRWNNNSSLLTSQYEVRRDHVCRPVIVGSDGKALPAFEGLPKQHHAKDDGGYGRSWADPPTGGDSYTYKSDPYQAQAFVSGVQTAVSSGGGGGGGGRFGLLHRPNADLYDYDNDDGEGDRYDEYSSSRPEPWRSAEAGRGWQTRKPAGAEPTWGVGGKHGGGGAARAAGGWGGDGKLSRATNVIDKAVEFIYDTPPRPAGRVARSDLWGGSQQPASMNQPASVYQPSKRSSSATPTIDSREAANKYGGQFIW